MSAYPLAIQSYCFRHFKPLPEFAVQLRSAGVTATELCAVHANFADPASAPEVVKTLNDAGVSIVAIGVEKLTGDEANDRPRFDWAKAAGLKQMSVTFPPEIMNDNFAALKRVEKSAEQYDLKLGIHNHGGYDWLGNKPILQYVLGHAGPRIGLHLDTAWAIDAKQNPVDWVETFGSRLFGVHLKDFIYNRERQSSDVIIGTGILDLPKFTAMLKQVNFDGPLVIEYEADLENPALKLKECVTVLRKMI